MTKNEYQVGELVEVAVERTSITSIIERQVVTYHAYIVERLDDGSYNVLADNSVLRYEGLLNVEKENIRYLRDYDDNEIYKRISEDEIDEAIEFIKATIKANEELDNSYERLKKYFKTFRDEYVEEDLNYFKGEK